MVQRNEFMLMFRYEPNNNYQPSEIEMAEMQQQWGSFIGEIAIREKLVSTHQLGFEGKQIFADQSVIDGIYIADKQTLGGSMILIANNVDEAVEIAKKCPILLMGGSVEVRAINPM